uniref:Uncharacterized protein n=1 Tax=Plectus sambesii TaxID=2011161 RepID=A0A914WSC5_9BILA
MWRITWPALLFASLLPGLIDSNTNAERELVEALLQNYSTTTRPVFDVTKPVRVVVYPTIYGMVDLDEIAESLTLMIWQGYRWTDEFLEWNNRSDEFFTSKESKNLSMINIPITQIWTPDVVVFNALDRTDIIERDQLIAKIYKNGTVLVSIPQVIPFRCRFMIEYFPFDTQNCTLVYGSWALTKDEIVVSTELNATVTDLSRIVLQAHSEWDILSLTNEHRLTDYMDEIASLDVGNIFSELHMTLTMKRKPAYYIYVLIIPTFVLTQINNMGMFVPHNAMSEREEKVTLGLLTLMTMAVILNIAADQVPRSAKGLPLLGWFVMFSILISALAILITVGLLWWHEYTVLNKVTPPKWLMWLYREKYKRTSKKQENEEKIMHHPNYLKLHSIESTVEHENRTPDLLQSTQLRDLIDTLRTQISRHEARIRAKELDADIDEIWVRLFRKIDATLLAIFFVGNILGSVLIFV